MTCNYLSHSVLLTFLVVSLPPRFPFALVLFDIVVTMDDICRLIKCTGCRLHGIRSCHLDRVLMLTQQLEFVRARVGKLRPEGQARDQLNTLPVKHNLFHSTFRHVPHFLFVFAISHLLSATGHGPCLGMSTKVVIYETTYSQRLQLNSMPSYNPIQSYIEPVNFTDNPS
jgi:hypothetical protein